VGLLQNASRPPVSSMPLCRFKNMPRSIPVATKKVVFTKSGYRCAFPGCNAPLTTKSGTFFGVIAHIVAFYAGGPRYDPNVPNHGITEENLIVLCPTCHALIDSEPANYHVDWLRNAKAAHELRIVGEGETTPPDVDVQTISTFHESLTFWSDNRQKHDEEVWQSFFDANPFVLSQAVPDHIIKLGDKCYVGGKSITNTGGNIIDFLFTTKIAKNVVLIEVKHPGTRLIGKQYRTNAFSMSDALSGSIVQVLNYRDDLLKNYFSLIGQNPDLEFTAFNPQCIVLAGDLDRENPTANQRRSFELFRNSLSNVRVLSYDEFFGKINDLVDIFTQ
jgi:Domain of unknown function (DUF4263)